MAAITVLIAGSGDLASAVAIRLYRAGYRVVLVAQNHPLDIHHKRSFSGAVFSGEKTIFKISVVTFGGVVESAPMEPDASVVEFINFTLTNRRIPLLFANELKLVGNFSFDYLFMADPEFSASIPGRIMEGATLLSIAGSELAPLSRYVLRTDGDCLGQVLYPFLEDEYPEELKSDDNESKKIFVRAPLEGVFSTQHSAGDLIHEKQELGRINEIPILSPASGEINGLLNSGLIVPVRTVFAEIAPAKHTSSHNLIPGSAFAVAGGVLEAILFDRNLKMNT